MVERIGRESVHLIPLLQAMQKEWNYLPHAALERLAERGDQSVLECWLPWARQWQSTPARRSNSTKSVDVLEVVEPIVLLGWHPQRADKEFALLVGSAEIWLDKVLKDYARRLDIFVDKQQGF